MKKYSSLDTFYVTGRGTIKIIEEENHKNIQVGSIINIDDKVHRVVGIELINKLGFGYDKKIGVVVSDINIKTAEEIANNYIKLSEKDKEYSLVCSKSDLLIFLHEVEKLNINFSAIGLSRNYEKDLFVIKSYSHNYKSEYYLTFLGHGYIQYYTNSHCYGFLFNSNTIKDHLNRLQ